MKYGSRVAKRTMVFVLSAVLALVAVFAFSYVQTAQAEEGNRSNVESWEELIAAIADDTSSDPIIITKDITAESQIEITKPVTIQGTNDATIYRQAGNADFPVFKVTGNGDLTLGAGLTMSGKSISCAGTAPAVTEQTEKVWRKYGKDTDFSGLSDGNRVILGYEGRGISNITSSGVVAVDDTTVFDADANDAAKFTLKEGLNADDYAFTLVDLTSEGYAYFKTASGKFLGRPTGNAFDPVGLVDENGTGYLKVEHDKGYGFKFTMSGADTTIAKYIFVFDDTERTFVIGARVRVNNRGGGWEKEYFYVEESSPYWAVDGYTDKFATEQAAIDFANEHKTGAGGCDTDTTTSACNTYTSSDFASGTPDAPRGFFVQVDGGTLNITGATLRDFVADGSVSHAAPIVANGGAVNMSGGEITHNSVGYTADNSYNSSSAQAIGMESEQGDYNYNGAMGGWPKTETAGGIILSAKSTGNITDGSISNNRGDTGGVLVQGKGHDNENTQNGADSRSKLTFNGGEISNNIGVHHGGGMTVYNGAGVTMGDGTTAPSISNNFSWHKGGGVFVSEDAFASWYRTNGPGTFKAVGDASFRLNSGSISNNVAVSRGGGIEVASNHVYLLGGSIEGNNSRVLGGGVYVEGDAGHMYQLYVAQGSITDNQAVSKEEQPALTRGPANTANDCSFSNDLTNPADGSDVTYLNGFWGDRGRGGGVWLCQMGGSSTLAISDTNTVIIGGNRATETGWGQDILLSQPPAGGDVGNTVNVVTQGANKFVNESNNEPVQNNTAYSGPLPLTNETTTYSGNGVKISGNSAINGGGIAANGAVVFGEPQNTYRIGAGLELKKVWVQDRTPETITLKFFAEVDGEKIQFDEVTLDGEAEEFNETIGSYESDSWKASVGLPLAVTKSDGTVKPLFAVKVGNDVYDPSVTDKREALYKAIEAGGTVELADWNLVIEEVIVQDDGTVVPQTFVMSSTQATIEDVTAEPEPGQPVTYVDMDGNPVFTDSAGNAITIGTYSVNFKFADSIHNDKKPEIEKYVNKDVHKDIVINEEYPYDILVYVPLNAEELKITDSLNAKLQYVSAKEDIEKSAMVKATNDHKVNGTVAATDGTEIAAKATISGQDLTVEFADVKEAQGKYIQISFTAKVKDGLSYDDIKDSDKETITNNGTVLEGAAEHTGIPNDAKYSFKVDNEWSSDYDSNTVTVEPKPEEPEIEKYVNKNVHSEIQLDETFTYDIVAYVTKDADSVTITDKLDAQLQFVSKEANIPTVSLGETVDHTPNGSVAEDGSPVSNAVAKISGDTLTVTIADAKALRGQWVKVSFDAKIKDGLAVEDLNYTPIDKNEPVITDEKHKGVPNDASYTIKVGNKVDFYSDNSNTVTVKPEEPQIEKYVAKDVHKEITVDEVFPYDVIVYVPTDADTIQIRDVLNDQLTFVDEAGAIAETAVVKNTNDHTVNGTVANSDGTPIAATASIEGQTLTVDIADATAARGKYIQITFNARLADDVDISALEMDTITDNGDVLGGLDSHTGVPNTAEYRIGIKNGSDVDWSKYAPEGDEDGWNKSNTVTVKPDDSKREIVISKVDGISGNELPGAALKVSDADGNEVASWASTSAAKRTSLQPGTYTLEETSAPTGYTAITSPITFSIAEDGTVTCSEDGDGAVTVTGRNRVVVTNTAQVNLSAEASKVSKHWDDGGNDALRKNVVFDLYFSSDKQTWYPANKSIELSASDAVEVEGMDTWATSFNNLPAVVDGKQAYYVAVERTDFTGQYVSGVNIEQLSGGAISISDGEEEVIEIISTVGGDGMDATNHPFTPNTSVEISKQQVGGGPELPGAKLTVYRIDEQGNRIEIETWTSGDAPHMLSGLEPGIYVLKEVTAPNGYEVAEEMTFRVNVDGTVEVLQNGQWFSAEDHIVMFDAPTTEPGKPGTPTQDKTAKPTKGTPAKTADAAGKTTVALLLAALLSVGGFAYAGSRTRTSRKK